MYRCTSCFKLWVEKIQGDSVPNGLEDTICEFCASPPKYWSAHNARMIDVMDCMDVKDLGVALKEVLQEFDRRITRLENEE